MSVDINNYELFVIDYLDGNLDEMKKQEMDLFLMLHPDIADELDDLNDIKLEKDSTDLINDSFSSSLKKEPIKKTRGIDEGNYEQYFLTHLENDMSKEDAVNLQLFLDVHPQLMSEFKLVQSLKLRPDNKIVFTNRENLKKESAKILPLWLTAISAAAILLLAIWILQPQASQRPSELLAKLSSKDMSQLKAKGNSYSIPNRDLVLYVSNTPASFLADEHIRLSTPEKLVLSQMQIAVKDENWKNEMLLMQSYAFERTQLFSIIELGDESKENKPSTIRLITSMLWKTTKGQIKNISQDVIQDDLKFWQSKNIEEFTNGYVSIKKTPSSPVE
ncbi:MAG: hypothetical protein GQ527_10530 [Bacteroidales bacterium]|nr:hypothetical protein [Bacteroidales bacterium]